MPSRLSLFLSLPFCFLFIHLKGQNWLPTGHTILPGDYIVMSLSAPNDSVVWMTASAYSVISSLEPVPHDHVLKVLKTTDAGETWQSLDVEIAEGHISFDIVGIDQRTAWLTTQSNGNGLANALYKTEDGGQSWQPSLEHAAVSVFVRAFDGQHIFCQANEYVAYSDNGGEDWHLDTLPYQPGEYNPTITGNNSAAISGDTLWVGTSNGRVVRFTDYGAEHSFFDLGSSTSVVISMAFEDDQHGILSYLDLISGTMSALRSNDGGETWHPMPGDPGMPYYIITQIPGRDSMYVAVSDVFSGIGEWSWTVDFGETWSPPENFSGKPVNGVAFYDHDTGWIGNGQVSNANEPAAFKWNGDLFTSINEWRPSHSTLVVYPNPVVNKIYFKTKSPLKENMKIWIYDMQGRLVDHHVTADAWISITALWPGNYYLLLNSGKRFFLSSFSKI